MSQADNDDDGNEDHMDGDFIRWLLTVYHIDQGSSSESGHEEKPTREGVQVVYPGHLTLSDLPVAKTTGSMPPATWVSCRSCTLNREHDMMAIEDIQESMGADDGNLPECAKVLEPVRKLPTNVGARIRKCINEALDKRPPEWAKKILEHSISK